MKTRLLTRDLLNLFIKIDGIGLQLCNLRVTVEGVTPSGCVPGGSRCQLRTFDQNYIFPAGFGEMIEDGYPDDSTPNDDDLCM